MTTCTSTTTFDMDDLALLHHWTVSTSLDIVRCPQVDYCWQTIFPRIALRHPFVMHGILSLAALHHAYRTGGTKKSVLAAISHHNTSLQGFRDNILNITDENSEGLFVSSTLNIIYIFGMLGRPSRKDMAQVDSSSPTARALGSDWIPMIRGVRPVLQGVYHHIRLGELSPLLELGNWNELEVDSELFPEDEYLCKIRETWVRSEQTGIYDEALQVLRRCFFFAYQFKTMEEQTLKKWGYNRSWAAPLIFLHHAPDEYFMQLQQRQPPALILFAYFGALLHGLNDIWFLEGWGRDIVQIIHEQLGTYWQPWMDRPRQAVRLV
ncbi:c6 zinc finger domain-containing [Fusarium longipes]|uniref:C6 zinc finger domain-containing n=1 Tax=Fusarium longipes TaxID=694270 RepID=A0A395T5N7_9HYPO|nr:c6 zinc finger domain-containing [Fusarium longipes]